MRRGSNFGVCEAAPFFALLEREPVGGRRWLAIVANLVATGDERVYRIGFDPGSVQDRINRCAVAAYPQRPAEEVAGRWRLASTALLQLVAAPPSSPTDAGGQLSPEASAVIVRFVASGLDGVCRTRG